MNRIAQLSGLMAAAALAGCGTLRTPVVRAERVCQDVTIPVYFAPDAATVTPDGRRLIAAEAARARGCKVDSVQVVGLADAAGEPAANLELSKRRAASVAAAIVRAGLPAAQFELSAVGQSGAVNAAGQMGPVRRRADVTLKLSKPK